MSTTSESQPIWAISSAAKPLGMAHQPLMTAPPLLQISRTRFARMAASSHRARRRRARTRSRQLSPGKSSPGTRAGSAQIRYSETMDVPAGERRAAIAAAYRAAETATVERLLGAITLDDAGRDRIAARAGALIAGVRARAASGGGIEKFLQEY